MNELKPERSYWIKSGTYVIFQRLGSLLFGFGSYFFLVRYYEVSVFGVWTLFLVLTTASEMSRSAFIQNAFIKFFNEGKVDKNKLFTASLFLNCCATVLFILILLGLIPILRSFWKTEVIQSLIYCYCVTSVILIPFTQLNYLEQANHRFSGVFWSNIIRQGLFFVIVIVCFVLFPRMSLTFFGWMQTVSALAGMLVAYFLCKRYLPEKLSLDWNLIRQLFGFGKYILGTGFTSNIGKNADQIILGNVSHASVAYYNAGVRILNLIEIPSLSISNIVYPKIAEKVNLEGNSGAGKLYEKSVAIILAIILPAVVVVLLFPQLVLLLTAGKKYLESAAVLRLMGTASLLIPFNIQVGSALEVINRPQVSFFINLVSNILNVVLNLILIPILGATGAAISFVVTVLVIFAVGQYYIMLFLDIKLIRIIKQVGISYRTAFFFLKGKLIK
ncbi:MAG: oligosaccharide flippase family protein [Cyclobacteriaceae bacterium]|nr:oligosaccharide flippase family protein [Cyclobacteriaceae bacterium]